MRTASQGDCSSQPRSLIQILPVRSCGFHLLWHDLGTYLSIPELQKGRQLDAIDRPQIPALSLPPDHYCNHSLPCTQGMAVPTWAFPTESGCPGLAHLGFGLRLAQSLLVQLWPGTSNSSSTWELVGNAASQVWARL